MVQGKVVTGSAYETVERIEVGAIASRKEWRQAQVVADSIPAPDVAYALDLCRFERQHRLLEPNLFSRADHYACDRVAIGEPIYKLAGWA